MGLDLEDQIRSEIRACSAALLYTYPETKGERWPQLIKQVVIADILTESADVLDSSKTALTRGEGRRKDRRARGRIRRAGV